MGLDGDWELKPSEKTRNNTNAINKHNFTPLALFWGFVDMFKT